MSEWTGISGSAAFDTVACPSRAALPQCRPPAGEAADRGTAIHEFARKVTLEPERRAIFEAEIAEEWRHTAVGLNIDAALEGITVKGLEMAYALDVKNRTCRFIGENIDRKYNEHLKSCGEPELGHYEIPFTIDVEGASHALQCPVELDYKTGQNVGEVEEHGQRKVSAAGLMLYHGADTTVSRICYIWDSGETKHDGHEFSILDAWQICDELIIGIDAVDAVKDQLARGETPTVYPDRDKQCKYCSAFDHCPYWNNLVSSVASGIGEPEALTPEARGRAFDRVKDVLKAYEAIEERLKEAVLRDSLPIDDKWEFRAEERRGRTSFDAPAARGMLITAFQRLGMNENAVNAEMVKLNRQGAPYQEIKKRKRVLPVLKQSA